MKAWSAECTHFRTMGKPSKTSNPKCWRKSGERACSRNASALRSSSSPEFGCVPNGVELSWDHLRGIDKYRLDYADALALPMTWNTFPEIIDGTGLERVSYIDTTASGHDTRFYRVKEYEQP